MSEVSLFYALTHIFISLIGGVLLFAIWYNIRKRFIHLLEENESEKRIDKGLLFLSLALFVWAIQAVGYISITAIHFLEPLVIQPYSTSFLS